MNTIMNDIYELVVEITFRTKLVASPASAEYGKYIAETPEVDDDVDVIQLNKFMRNDDGNPVLKDYQLLGFIKSHLSKRYRRDIDEFVCIEERYITLQCDPPHMETIEKRPTMLEREFNELARIINELGEICNCRSEIATFDEGRKVQAEVAPEGAKCHLTFRCRGKEALENVIEALNHGFEGFGFMRNYGYGKFSWECLELKKLDK